MVRIERQDSLDNDLSATDSASYQWCQHVANDEPISVLGIIRQIGEQYRTVVFLKYDFLRDVNKWTIIARNERVTDTDDPVGALRQLLRELAE